jgi:hypothetical protein
VDRLRPPREYTKMTVRIRLILPIDAPRSDAVTVQASPKR